MQWQNASSILRLVILAAGEVGNHLVVPYLQHLDRVPKDAELWTTQENFGWWLGSRVQEQYSSLRERVLAAAEAPVLSSETRAMYEECDVLWKQVKSDLSREKYPSRNIWSRFQAADRV